MWSVFTVLFSLLIIFFVYKDPVNGESRLIGGRPIDIIEAPYMVSVRRYGTHTCGGSIIREKIVVTAAQCVHRISPVYLVVQAGTSSGFYDGVSILVDEVETHPDYDQGNLSNDIAILILRSSLTYSGRIKPILLPSVGEEVAIGAKLKIFGWQRESNEATAEPSLHSVEVAVQSIVRCENMYGKDIVKSSKICAGEPTGGVGPCSGDFGGPAVIDDVLIGIVSWEYVCGQAEYPGMYSKVSFYRNWIASIVGS